MIGSFGICLRQAPIEFVLTATIVVSSTKLSVGGGGLKKGMRTKVNDIIFRFENA